MSRSRAASLVGLVIAVVTFVAFVLPLSACAPTDTGNPPLDLDEDRVRGTGFSGLVGTIVDFTGEVGAVVPAEGDVVGMFLDEPAAFARRPVVGDGSFGLSLEGNGRSVRVWIEREDGAADEATSAVVDWRIEDDASLSRRPELDPCLQLSEAVRLTRGGTVIVPIANECGAPITLSVGGVLGDITATADESVASGDFGELTIQVQPDAAGGAVVQLVLSGALDREVQVSGIVR